MAPRRRVLSEDDRGHLAERVLSASSGMVGACATLVGLVKLMEHRQGVSHVDEYAGLTAAAFVISAFLAYLSLRIVRYPRLQAQLEWAADLIFLMAMLVLAAIGVAFAFDLI